VQQSDPVVGGNQPLTKPKLHAALMQGWSRAIAKFGKGGFADKLEVSVTALDKQLTGSMPGFELIDRAFDHDPSVLDDWAREKGVRLVAAEAVCDVDDLNLLIGRVLVLINEATHPDSPGGRAIIHSEKLKGEDLMRQLHHTSGQWLSECADLRRPRSVA